MIPNAPPEVSAPNLYAGTCQGLDPDDFYRFVPVRLRSASAEWAVGGDINPDDWQRIIILRSNLNAQGGPAVPVYPRLQPRGQLTPPAGAYLEYAGNRWIVFKSKTMDCVPGNALVRRCNAVGTVRNGQGTAVSLLMAVARGATAENANRSGEFVTYPSHYISAVTQLNAATAFITEGTRVMLGGAAYAVRGVNGFLRSDTYDADSAHLLSFALERSPTNVYDLELQQ